MRRLIGIALVLVLTLPTMGSAQAPATPVAASVPPHGIAWRLVGAVYLGAMGYNAARGVEEVRSMRNVIDLGWPHQTVWEGQKAALTVVAPVLYWRETAEYAKTHPRKAMALRLTLSAGFLGHAWLQHQQTQRNWGRR